MEIDGRGLKYTGVYRLAGHSYIYEGRKKNKKTTLIYIERDEFNSMTQTEVFSCARASRTYIYSF